MIGKTPLERARTRELERIVEIGVLRPIAEIVHATASPLGVPPNPEIAKVNRDRLPNNLAIVEDRLSDGRPFLMGEATTIADCTLAAGLQFGRFAQFEIDPSYAHIRRWDEAFRKRASAQQILTT